MQKVQMLHSGFLPAGEHSFDFASGDLPSGSYEQIIASIKNKVMVLPDNTVILPGHGPATSVGVEHVTNPYIN